MTHKGVNMYTGQQDPLHYSLMINFVVMSSDLQPSEEMGGAIN